MTSGRKNLQAGSSGRQLELLKSPASNEVSRPGNLERDFRVRLQQAGRERRDQHIESLRRKYAPKITALQERVRRADQQRQKQQAESKTSQVQAAISVGASILGAFLGRKPSVRRTLAGRRRPFAAPVVC